MPVELQIAIIFASTRGFIDKIPLNKVKEFEAQYHNILKAEHQGTLDKIRSGKIDDEITDVLSKVAKELAKNFTI
jgi:F-type H+-transporting ATPase subunit alpha